ncbi:hypothetical protein D3Z58_15020 [Clostridiaceae bacterium]|nr:hypothetical protein [Clostridiaceae bacterium]
MDTNWMIYLQSQNQLAKVMETNRTTEKWGLVLNEQEAKLILEERAHALRQERRVEFGPGIAEKVIYEFCNSDFINQENYVDTIIRLQEIFYLYKNEMQDEITDDELLHLMKEQFENLCYGDLDYLEGTCLDNFAQAIRAGYEGHKKTDGYGQYAAFDQEKRWDYELYYETLKELCWG